MRPSIPGALPLALVALASLVFPSAHAQARYPLTVESDLGRTVIRAQPRRVVVAGAVGLEMLLALGVQPVGYATSDPVDVRPGAALGSLPFVGERLRGAAYLGLVGQPSLEATLALRPDLIVVSDFPGAALPDFSKIAPTLAYQVEDWRKTIVVLGRALGREARAAEALREFERAVRLTRAALGPALSRGSRASYAVLAGQRNYVYGPTSYVGGLLAGVGFDLVLPPGVAANLYGYAQVQSEALAGLRAEFALVTSFGDVGPALALLRRGATRVLELPFVPGRASQGPYSSAALLEDVRRLALGRAGSP